MKLVSFKRMMAAAGLLFVAAAALSIGAVVTDERNRWEAARARAERQARHAVRQIDQELSRFVPVVHDLAAGLSEGRIRNGDLLPRMRRAMEEHPHLYGIATLWTEYSYDPEVRLFAPYLLRDGDELRWLQVEESYDYTTDPTKRWYHRTLAEGPRWLDEWGAASRQLLVVYAEPFFHPGNGEPMGVICMTYTFQWIEEWIHELHLGATGYGFVLSPAGRLVVHPSEDFVESRRTLFEIAEERQDPVLAELAHRATAGERGILEHPGVAGGTEWIVFEPIPETGFSLAAAFLEEEVLAHGPDFRRRLLHIALLLAAALFALGAALSLHWLEGRPEALLWTQSVWTSLLCLALIGFVWDVGRYVEIDEEAVHIVDGAGLESYLAHALPGAASHSAGPPVYIPTGVFLQSLDFSSPYNVHMTGYVWQKFEDGVHDEVERGFILPEAVALDVEEAYRRRDGSVETVGWYFEGELRQSFDYSLYPFDHGEAWLRLWPKEFDKNVIPVPDLEAYPLINPHFKPGLDPGVVLPGWTLTETFFAYRAASYTTDFGIAGYAGRESFPELYFNAALRRNFLDSFIAHMIPLIVVAFMLFAILMTVTQDERRVSLTGFNVFGVLTATSALFFVALVAHIQLREAIRAGELMYLEYFYFAIYLTILFGSIHSLAFCSEHVRWRWLRYRNSLLLKTAFWPLLLAACLGVTLITFY